MATGTFRTTVEALEAAFDQDVQDLIDMGNSPADARRLADLMGDSRDEVAQAPDGTWYVPEGTSDLGGFVRKPRKREAVEAVDPSGDLHKRFPREYSSWRHAKARAFSRTDGKWPSHGGRGIVMADAWRDSFAAFLADMGPRPKGTSLERIRNNGPYAKTNCRWATASEQNANRRGWAKPR